MKNTRTASVRRVRHRGDDPERAAPRDRALLRGHSRLRLVRSEHGEDPHAHARRGARGREGALARRAPRRARATDGGEARSAWRAGRRDRALEGQAALLATWVRCRAACRGHRLLRRVVGDSLVARNGAVGTGFAMLPRGPMVFHVHQAIRDYVPSYEEYRPALQREQDQKRAEQEEKGARELFDRDPSRWASGKVLHYSEVLVPSPDPLFTPLPAASRALPPGASRPLLGDRAAARPHILVSRGPSRRPRPRRTGGQQCSTRARGEDIAELARRHSDDPPSQRRAAIWASRRGVMLGSSSARRRAQGGRGERLGSHAGGWHHQVIDTCRSSRSRSSTCTRTSARTPRARRAAHDEAAATA